MKIGIGLKCPTGHFNVQTMLGEPVCPKCGLKLVKDDNAADTAMNRVCSSCGLSIGLNVFDTGVCPKCGKPWK